MGLLRTDVPRPPAWPLPRAARDVQDVWRYASRRDPVGHAVHTALAALHLLTLPLATVAASYSFALLVLYAALRAPNTWRSCLPMLRAPMSGALVAWVAWFALALTWSDHPGQGWDELQAARMLLLPVLLWPVLDRLPWLIAAALIGVAAQNLVQVVQVLEWLGQAPEAGGRARGLLHPIQTGAWCVAAACWHLGAALAGRGWLRWISLGGLALALVGLALCGSRGPWLAAAIVGPLALVLLTVRRRGARPLGAGIAIVVIVAGAASWPLVKPRLLPRIGAVTTEIAEARNEGLYASSVGLRLGLWTWAWQLFRAHPVMGVGAGDFESAVEDLPAFEAAVERALDVGRVEGRAADEATIRDYLGRAHAHSTYLHTLAQLGLVGGGLLALVLTVLLWQCARDRLDHVYADGTAFVVLAWMVGAQFDCYELNGHLLGLLGLAIAATWPYRPPVATPRFALDAPRPEAN